jgi:hypothetical protein
MSVEDFRPMGEQEAHEEANILRAKIGISPESGKVEGLDLRHDREPMAEDYDKALEAVEKLKRLAKEEPDALKVWNRVNNAIDRLITLPGHGLLFLARVTHALMGPEPGGPKERWRRNADITEPMAEFDGIERELRMLRAKAEQFGAKETQRGTGRSSRATSLPEESGN